MTEQSLLYKAWVYKGGGADALNAAQAAQSTADAGLAAGLAAGTAAAAAAAGVTSLATEVQANAAATAATLTTHQAEITAAQTTADAASASAQQANQAAENAQQTGDQALQKTQHWVFSSNSMQNLYQPTLALSFSNDQYITVNKSLQADRVQAITALAAPAWISPSNGREETVTEPDPTNALNTVTRVKFPRLEMTMTDGLRFGSGIQAKVGGPDLDYCKIDRTGTISCLNQSTGLLEAITSNACPAKGGVALESSGLTVAGRPVISSAGKIIRRVDVNAVDGFKVSPSGYLTMGGLQGAQSSADAAMGSAAAAGSSAAANAAAIVSINAAQTTQDAAIAAAQASATSAGTAASAAQTSADTAQSTANTALNTATSASNTAATAQSLGQANSNALRTQWATNGAVVYTLSNVGIGVGTSSVDAGCSLKCTAGIIAYNTFCGDVGYGATYAGWSTAGPITKSTGGYAMLQDPNGYTCVNAASGQSIEIRNNNNTRAVIGGSSSTFNGDFTISGGDVYMGNRGTTLKVSPGMQGGSTTANYVTYDINSGATNGMHYFYDSLYSTQWIGAPSA